MIETATVVKVFGKRVWVEKDFMGTVHIKMQHEGGFEPFDFIQIQYDYAYTSNANQAWLAEQILKLLGVNADPTSVEQQSAPEAKP